MRSFDLSRSFVAEYKGHVVNIVNLTNKASKAAQRLAAPLTIGLYQIDGRVTTRICILQFGLFPKNYRIYTLYRLSIYALGYLSRSFPKIRS